VFGGITIKTNNNWIWERLQQDNSIDEKANQEKTWIFIAKN
jgi:hypothetical protein